MRRVVDVHVAADLPQRDQRVQHVSELEEDFGLRHEACDGLVLVGDARGVGGLLLGLAKLLLELCSEASLVSFCVRQAHLRPCSSARAWFLRA